MSRKNKRKKIKKQFEKGKRPGRFDLPGETKQMILGILMILLAALIALGFFEKAGKAGEFFTKSARFFY